MQLLVDTHTHTYASGHAYSTLIENAKSAKASGLALFCTTDHTDSMPGAPHYWFFANQKILPRFIEGVGVIRGAEANILNLQGEVDLHPSLDGKLDWVIGSFHEPVFPPSDKSTHTQALIAVIESGRVDALGHLGNPNFDFDAVIEKAVERNVAIEINNTSLLGNSRIGSIERCEAILRCCIKHGAYITTGSDAHYCDYIGRLDLVKELLIKTNAPKNKVITHSAKQFLSFIELRGHKAIPEFSSLINNE